MQIAILLFDRLTVLDAIGPYQVLMSWSLLASADGGPCERP